RCPDVPLSGIFAFNRNRQLFGHCDYHYFLRYVSRFGNVRDEQYRYQECPYFPEMANRWLGCFIGNTGIDAAQRWWSECIAKYDLNNRLAVFGHYAVI